MITKYACFVETQTMEEITLQPKLSSLLSPPVVCVLTNHLCTVILGRVSMILKYACFVETQTMEEKAKSMRKQLSKQVKKRIRQVTIRRIAHRIMLLIHHTNLFQLKNPTHHYKSRIFFIITIRYERVD